LLSLDEFAKSRINHVLGCGFTIYTEIDSLIINLEFVFTEFKLKFKFPAAHRRQSYGASATCSAG
jgi:hypothetical protein